MREKGGVGSRQEGCWVVLGCMYSSARTTVKDDREGVRHNIRNEGVEGTTIPLMLAMLATTCVSTTPLGLPHTDILGVMETLLR